MVLGNTVLLEPRLMLYVCTANLLGNHETAAALSGVLPPAVLSPPEVSVSPHQDTAQRTPWKEGGWER